MIADDKDIKTHIGFELDTRRVVLKAGNEGRDVDTNTCIRILVYFCGYKVRQAGRKAIEIKNNGKAVVMVITPEIAEDICELINRFCKNNDLDYVAEVIGEEG